MDKLDIIGIIYSYLSIAKFIEKLVIECYKVKKKINKFIYKRSRFIFLCIQYVFAQS